MDISELTLKINKNKAIHDLHSVQSELNKTASSADGLISTLKDIGVGMGLAALAKESLELNFQLTSLDRRFKSVFGSESTEGLKNLVNNFNLSEIAAKKVLATIGQFAVGMGHSREFTESFSEDLAKAAADWSAFSGLPVEETARKFAKATLGETGELKEIGIIIDINTESFKNLTKSIQESTGMTEAQAKQFAILKGIIEQTSLANGAAAANMFDGWTQLQVLLENFKGILGSVGKIIGATFSPFLILLNKITGSDIGKWTIALGTSFVFLHLTFGRIIKIGKQLASELSKIGRSSLDKGFALSLETKLKSLLSINEQWNNQVKKVREQYDALYKNILKTVDKNKEFNLPQGSYSQLTSSQRKKVNKVIHSVEFEKFPGLTKDWDNVQKEYDGYKESLKGLNFQLGDISEELMGSLNPSLQTFLNTIIATTAAAKVYNLELIKQGMASSIAAATAKYTALNHTILAVVTGIPVVIKSAFTGLFSWILSGFSKIGKVIKGIFVGNSLHNVSTAAAEVGKTAGVAAVTTGSLAAGLGKLSIALLETIGLIAGIAAAITILAIGIEGGYRTLVKGEDAFDSFFHGTIATSIADFLYNITGTMDEIAAKSKELTEKVKSIWGNILRIAELKEELNKINLDQAIDKMLPVDSIKALKKRSSESQKEINKLTWMIANMGTAQARGMFSLSAGQTIDEKRLEFQEKLNNLTREYYSDINKLEQVSANLKNKLQEIENLSNEIGDIHWEKWLETAKPSEAIESLNEEIQLSKDNINKTSKEIDNLKKEMQKWGDGEERFAPKMLELQKKLSNETQEYYQLQGKLNNVLSQSNSHLSNFKNLESELEKINFDRQLSKFSHTQLIGSLNAQLLGNKAAIEATITDINRLKTGILSGDLKEIDVAPELVNLQTKLNKLTSDRISLEDKLANEQQKLINKNLEYSNKIAKINNDLIKLNEVFSYGYKDGAFGNFSEDNKMKNLKNDMTSILNDYNNLLNNEKKSKSLDVNSLKTRQSLAQKYFELIKEEGRLKLDTLAKEREAMISNLTSMIDMIKEASQFRETSQLAIESKSLESIRLQSRQQGDINEDVLSPVIEQQKAVKEIELKMLKQQEKTTTTLGKVSNVLVNITKKIGKSQGATNFDVVTAI